MSSTYALSNELVQLMMHSADCPLDVICGFQQVGTVSVLTLFDSHTSATLIHVMCCAGFVLVIVMKPLSKQVVVTFLPLVYKMVPVDLRKLWQPPLHSLKPPKHEGIPVDENGQSWDVSVTARFISYASIGWTVVDLAPFMFQVLGLSVPRGPS